MTALVSINKIKLNFVFKMTIRKNGEDSADAAVTEKYYITGL